MTREEINALVQELGFYRKASPDEAVPPEYTCGRPLGPPKALLTALTCRSGDAAPPCLSPGDRMKRSAAREHHPR